MFHCLLPLSFRVFLYHPFRIKIVWTKNIKWKRVSMLSCPVILWTINSKSESNSRCFFFFFELFLPGNNFCENLKRNPQKVVVMLQCRCNCGRDSISDQFSLPMSSWIRRLFPFSLIQFSSRLKNSPLPLSFWKKPRLRKELFGLVPIDWLVN